MSVITSQITKYCLFKSLSRIITKNILKIRISGPQENTPAVLWKDKIAKSSPLLYCHDLLPCPYDQVLIVIYQIDWYVYIMPTLYSVSGITYNVYE